MAGPPAGKADTSIKNETWPIGFDAELLSAIRISAFLILTESFFGDVPRALKFHRIV